MPHRDSELGGGNSVVGAAIAKARELNLRVSVTVCDQDGRLIALNCMSGAYAQVNHFAIGKAVASAGSGLPSGEATAGQGAPPRPPFDFGTATFLDSFRYLDQHARLAKHGVSILFHNTLASSEYGLLDQNTFAPRPNYWAALLWHRLMGSTVLDAGVPIREGLHVYAHCLAGTPGGIALLAINNSRTQPSSITLPMEADRYTLSAEQLESPTVQLNGHDLELGRNDELPDLSGKGIPPGAVELAPATISFLIMESASNESCR